MGVSQQIVEEVEGLLGRAPRGLEDVAVYDTAGRPSVIRVASLVDDRPFPTLFWLVDPALSYRIDQAEAAGVIAQLQAEVDASAELQRRMREDHLKHIALRDHYLTPTVRARLAALNFSDVLKQKGIGGIADFSRIRCLHTWYAAHLVVSNTVGRMLDEHWQNYPG